MMRALADLMAHTLEAVASELERASNEADTTGPPIRPIREDRELPVSEMPVPSGTSSPVSVGTHDEIHPNQVIQA